MKFISVFICLNAIVALASTSAVIDPSLKQSKLFFKNGGGETENVMISFNKGIKTVIDQIAKLNISSLVKRRDTLVKAQRTLTNLVQKPLQKFLERMGIDSQSFWISNVMVARNVSSNLVNAISKIPGVAKIEKEPEVKIQIPKVVTDVNKRQSDELPWGLTTIRADKVWSSNNIKGKGVVVGAIDTGVLYTHEAIKHNWRSSYGWYDPYRKTELPNDQNGHGTHVTGTIAGRNVGVAPEATWIHCKGCDTSSCGTTELLACGQWMLCPTKPDGSDENCGMAPQIVSNSWASGPNQQWFDGVIESWQAAGIIPVFSAANSGPQCGTVRSPADRPKNIAVGSTTVRERISEFSSLGSNSPDDPLKPNIAAPGSDVYSSYHWGDDRYSTLSGTSMACPHVSGVIALMLQKNPNLKYNQVYNAIVRTAVRKELDTSTAPTCAGKRPDSFPNNVFGHGRIDAYAAVNAV